MGYIQTALAFLWAAFMLFGSFAGIAEDPSILIFGILISCFYGGIGYLYLMGARRLYKDLKQDMLNYVLAAYFSAIPFLIIIGLIVGFITGLIAG